MLALNESTYWNPNEGKVYLLPRKRSYANTSRFIGRSHNYNFYRNNIVGIFELCCRFIIKSNRKWDWIDLGNKKHTSVRILGKESAINRPAIQKTSPNIISDDIETLKVQLEFARLSQACQLANIKSRNVDRCASSNGVFRGHSK